MPTMIRHQAKGAKPRFETKSRKLRTTTSAEKKAAEFSFFLAMPTMAGAFAYDLLKSYKFLTFDDGILIVVGFVAAFFSALIVVRSFLDFVSRHGFAVFAWWRIIVGMVGLAGLWIVG